MQTSQDNQPLTDIQLANHAEIAKGKVRHLFDLDDKHMLMVASDRLSAFDVILPQGIPNKGKILTSLAMFWFERFNNLTPNHLGDFKLEDIGLLPEELALLSGRTMIVRKLKPLPVEAIVRGYIIGSGWKDYQENGQICGIDLPQGLQQAEQLETPIFTPSSKAAVGDHDENISIKTMQNKIGKALAAKVQAVSLDLYSNAAKYALERGIIIADTKFEFGLDEDEHLVLMDEILTPDSSRFWPQAKYKVGTSPESFDKQFIRDHLETLDWDKTPPGPMLPGKIITQTAEKYQQVASLLMGA